MPRREMLQNLPRPCPGIARHVHVVAKRRLPQCDGDGFTSVAIDVMQWHTVQPHRETSDAPPLLQPHRVASPQEYKSKYLFLGENRYHDQFFKNRY